MCSSYNLSAIGTNTSYHLSSPVLSPPMSSNAIRRNVAIMQGVERRAQFPDELHGHPCRVLGVLGGVRAIVRGPQRRAHAERVRAGATESVPVNDGKAQMIAHR